jgi:hypothetical protein
VSGEIIGRRKMLVHIIECYAIRQKSTGNFLPAGRGRGFTKDEPTHPSARLPRLFSLKHHAESALKWWLQGITSRCWSGGYGGGYPYDDDPVEDIKTEPVEGREKGDMEIVLVRLSVHDPAAVPTTLSHGVSCTKVEHRVGMPGYLHSTNDDLPYDVDGVMYCGRCHCAI